MANNSFTLNAKLRDVKGKGASRRLRHLGEVPAVIYGAKKEPESLVLDHNEVSNALKNEAFYSHILTLLVDAKGKKLEEKVILRDMQRHPFRPLITHMDFQRISATEKLTMNVPLHFVGGEVSPGVKESGGIVSHLLSEVQIKCLPADLPEFIEVSLAHLNLNETVNLADLKLPKGVELVDLAHGENKPVATVYIPRMIEVEEVKPVAAVEGAVEGAEGAAPGAPGAAASAEGAKAAEGGATAAPVAGGAKKEAGPAPRKKEAVNKGGRGK
jgi:large subunit ribosomal protein L25